MNYFGCRDDFAIDVGEQLDHTGHCRLDFYARGIHLNQADNRAYVSTALHHWPTGWFSSEDWTAADIYWEVPLSSSAEKLAEKVAADNELFQKHVGFSIGPVADSFSLLAFGRPTDFVLLIIRNDSWFGDYDGDLSIWNVLTLPGTDKAPVRWLSVTLPRQEFKDICTEAHACLSRLVSAD